jgi:MtaA/CmuA family methyltransferase
MSQSLPQRPVPTGRRARLLSALAREPVDRPPVICAGGALTALTAGVVSQSGSSLPRAHLDAGEMASLALAAARITGFESVGVPLCATLEADAFGVPVELGDERTEARIIREPYQHSRDVPRRPVEELLQTGRVPVAIEAIRRLVETAGDLPIIGNLLGPLSVAAELVEPVTFFKELRTAPAEAGALLEYTGDFLAALGRAFIEAGADVLTVCEDTATPELIGPKRFADVALPHLNRLIDRLQAGGVPVILHMCGAVDRAAESIDALHATGFLPDAKVSIAALRERHPNLTLVGNINTFLLHNGESDAIGNVTRRIVADGTHIVCPSCSMASATPLHNIHALTHTVAGDC